MCSSIQSIKHHHITQVGHHLCSVFVSAHSTMTQCIMYYSFVFMDGSCTRVPTHTYTHFIHTHWIPCYSYWPCGTLLTLCGDLNIARTTFKVVDDEKWHQQIGLPFHRLLGMGWCVGTMSRYRTSNIGKQNLTFQ